MKVLVLLGAASGALACTSVDPDPNVGSVRSAISGGQTDATDSNVFAVVSHRGAAGIALCSASLIAPNLLLTARHCVSNVTTEVVTCGQTVASAPFAADTFFAANSESLNDAASAFKGASVSVPTQDSDICGFDVALITLDSLVPSNVAVPLVPRIDSAVQRGEVYSAVGYGQTTPGDAGLAGVRMERGGLLVNCAPGTCGQGVEASEFVGETGICSGDSGGPALDSSGKVVGVVSRSEDDCSNPIYGSVASWKDWLTTVATQAATRGNYTAPFWVTTGTSDAPPDSGAAGAPDTTANSSGTQGQVCTSPQDCKTGFGCYSPTSSANNAYCAEFCDAQTACSSGTHCESGVGVCVSGSSSHSSSSCAVRAGSRPAGGLFGGALLGFTVLGLFGWRRRRRASARRERCFV